MTAQRAEDFAPNGMAARSGAAEPVSMAYRALVLTVLIAVYAFNFIDRQILAILAGQIKADLHLTDTQLGLMSGLAFAIFYTALGLPIAWLADRWSRTSIMAISFAVWSGFTALCGAATSFWSLFLFRMGVGVGEAGGVAPAYSLISDYFPKEQRGRALAIFSFGIPIGSAAGILFGGLVAHAVNWRMAFVVVGLVGLVLSPLVFFVIRDPRRGGYDAIRRDPTPVDGMASPPIAVSEPKLSLLFRKPSFWLISFGAASHAIFNYGVSFWLPSFFERSWQMSLVDRSIYLSAMTVCAGIAGIWMGGHFGDRFGKKNAGNYLITPVVATIIGMPFFLAAIYVKSLPIAFALFFISQGLNQLWPGPIIASVQNLAPASQRSLASSVFLFINNLLGIAVGTWFFGAVADALAPRYGTEALRYAIYFGVLFNILSASLWIVASRRLARDWVD